MPPKQDVQVKTPEKLIDLTRFDLGPFSRTSVFGFANDYEVPDISAATDILSTIGTASDERSYLHDQLVEGDTGFPETAEEVAMGALRALSMLNHPVFAGRIEKSERGILEAAPRFFEVQGFVEKAPRFKEQVVDNTREMPFAFSSLKMHQEATTEDNSTMTEVDGLRELWAYLENYVDQNAKRRAQSSKHYTPIAQSMLENMTFIGTPEFERATAGLAQYWKDYLRDPNNVLCLITDISDSKKYPGKVKSDEFVKRAVLSRFTEEEIAEYGDRIVSSVEELQSTDPTRAKVIILDDWALSGTQVSRVISELWEDPDFDQYRRRLELNFLVATEDRLDDGLKNQIESYIPNIPVRAYFKANAATASEYGAHISGMHCTSNYDFGTPIWKMAKGFSKQGGILPPRLARVVRPYRNGTGEF